MSSVPVGRGVVVFPFQQVVVLAGLVWLAQVCSVLVSTVLSLTPWQRPLVYFKLFSNICRHSSNPDGQSGFGGTRDCIIALSPFLSTVL